MPFRLLVVDAEGRGRAPALRVRTLRRVPGEPGISVHFRPVRQDGLFESARHASRLAERILRTEGLLRGQLWLEFEVDGPAFNVLGRSADLTLALAIVAAGWPHALPESASVGATGALDEAGRVLGAEQVAAKLGALHACAAPDGTVLGFYPAGSPGGVDAADPTVAFHPVTRLDEALARLGLPLTRTVLGNPFRGLERFEFEHRAQYYGRDREVADVAAQLLRREAAGTPGVLVEGASGSGKSSFLNAGVLAVLLEPWRAASATRAAIEARPPSPEAAHLAWHPGEVGQGADARALVHSVVACWRRCALLDAPADGVDDVAGLLAWWKRQWPAGRRFVWIVDQLEELFGLGSPSAATALGALLSGLQREGAWTLACVRSDAVPSLQAFAALREVFGVNEGRYWLEPLRGAALEDCIRQPAAAAGLEFEVDEGGRALDRALVEEAREEPLALPLLSFTLEALYERRTEHRLTWTAYRALGGVRGSLASAAARVLTDGEETRDLLRSLVRVDNGRAGRRYAPLAELAERPAAEALARRLVDARLCVIEGAADGPVISLAHEALFDVVPLIRDWLEREAGLLQVREMAQRDAEAWEARGRNPAWVAAADRLASYRTLLESGIAVSGSLRAFVGHSMARDARARHWRRAAVAMISVLAIVASAAGWTARQKQLLAEQYTRAAVAAKWQLVTEAAAESLRAGDLTTARGLILEAMRRRDRSRVVDPATNNVFQELRGRDPLRAVLVAHDTLVRRLQWSPDGRRLAAVANGEHLHVWDAATGVHLYRAPLGGKPSSAPEFSPDGRTIVTGGVEIAFTDANTGELLERHPVEGMPRAHAQFLPNGRDVLLSGRGFEVWRQHPWSRVRAFATGEDDLSLARRSGNGQFVAAVRSDNSVGVWRLRDGARVATLRGAPETVTGLAWSADGRRIAASCTNTSVYVWDAASGALIHTFGKLPGQVWSAALSPDGSRLAAGVTDHVIYLYDVDSGAALGTLTGHTGIVAALQFERGGQVLASGGYDGTVRLWTMPGATSARPLVEPGLKVTALSYAPDGSAVVVGGEDGRVRVLDPRSSNESVRRVMTAPGAVDQLSFSRDGRMLLGASFGHGLRLWDAGTGSVIRDVPVEPEEARVASLSPDARFTAIGYLDRWTLVDNSTGRVVREFKGHREFLSALIFSNDGHRLLSASLDRTAALWNVDSGVRERVLPHPDFVYAAAMNAAGTRVATANEDHLGRIWDLRSGALQLELFGHPNRINAIAFSPDGRRVATAGRDQTVRLWDAVTGEQQQVLVGTSVREVWVGFSPDGAQIAALDSEGVAHRWSTPPVVSVDDQIRWADLGNPDPLTAVQRARFGLDEQPSGPDVPSDECEREAAAPYETRRRSPGHELDDVNGDLAEPACARPARGLASGVWEFRSGRAQVAAGKVAEGEARLRASWRVGYLPAAVDLAAVLMRTDAGHGEARAILEAAWARGLSRAGADLVRDHPDPALLARVEAAGEPSAYALQGDREERASLAAAEPAVRRSHLERAMHAYEQAVRDAERQNFPEQTARDWRFRRATLARLLIGTGTTADASTH
jgi:WD40 repeat protein